MDKPRPGMVVCLLWIFLVSARFELCASLNEEGKALLALKAKVEEDPFDALSNWDEDDPDSCSWFGVECSEDGKVVALNLEDLCLKGTLTPELGTLIQLKTLILRNNSFSGVIPWEIGKLRKLEVLDLWHNNLSGPLPSELSGFLSLEILVPRINIFAGDLLSEFYDLNVIKQIQIDEELPYPNRRFITRNVKNATIRRLLVAGPKDPQNKKVKAATTVAQPPKRLDALTSGVSGRDKPPAAVAESPSSLNPPSPSPSSPDTSPTSKNTSKPVIVAPPSVPAPSNNSSRKVSWIIYVSIGGSVCLMIALCAAYVFWCRSKNVATVMPWATGISGKLQKAFVTGVPSLKRSELEAACEEFSNVIGSLSNCNLYKGTLSSGVEIAVTSPIITLGDDWSEEQEAQFRKKISVLSKINHKNFVNLIGYCVEEEPFTRMMVFEYAPNGTLYEHLHIKEAEPLDWAARLRIAMGIVFCLEHAEQLDPPVTFKTLNSSSIYLTEDYAAKVSDLEFWNEKKADPASESSDQESTAYKFGIILLELISGRLQFSEDDGLLVLWASSYLSGKRPLADMVDTTLTSVPGEHISALTEVIRSCTNPEPNERPTMAEVAGRMKVITGIMPEAAHPRLSPLWWSEIEIISQ